MTHGDNKLMRVFPENFCVTGNMSEALTTALKSGYKEKCQSYVILLNKTSSVTDLLHYGDDLRMINTRAR
jgi:hypothetical protein